MYKFSSKACKLNRVPVGSLSSRYTGVKDFWEKNCTIDFLTIESVAENSRIRNSKTKHDASGSLVNSALSTLTGSLKITNASRVNQNNLEYPLNLNTCIQLTLKGCVGCSLANHQKLKWSFPTITYKFKGKED